MGYFIMELDKLKKKFAAAMKVPQAMIWEDLAKNLVSVQPMSTPSNQIFLCRFQV